jgi:hypothetical protein
MLELHRAGHIELPAKRMCPPNNAARHRAPTLELPLAASTPWELMAAASKIPEVVYEALLKFAAQAELLHNDDTPRRVQSLRREIEAAQDPDPRTGTFTTSIIAQADSDHAIMEGCSRLAFPTFSVSPKVTPMALTQRDRQRVRRVFQHRFLRSTHILSLLGGSRQQILRRLQLLYHHGCLDRPRAQVDYYRRGARAMV